MCSFICTWVWNWVVWITICGSVLQRVLETFFSNWNVLVCGHVCFIFLYWALRVTISRLVSQSGLECSRSFCAPQMYSFVGTYISFSGIGQSELQFVVQCFNLDWSPRGLFVHLKCVHLWAWVLYSVELGRLSHNLWFNIFLSPLFSFLYITPPHSPPPPLFSCRFRSSLISSLPSPVSPTASPPSSANLPCHQRSKKATILIIFAPLSSLLSPRPSPPL